MKATTRLVETKLPAPVRASKLEPDLEMTCVLSIARAKDGTMAVMLEIDGSVVRGSGELGPKRDALITLARAVTEVQRVVAAPVGRGRR